MAKNNKTPVHCMYLRRLILKSGKNTRKTRRQKKYTHTHTKYAIYFEGNDDLCAIDENGRQTERK